MEENNDILSKLREAIERCEDMKKLPQGLKATASVNAKLKKMCNEANERLKKTQEFLNCVMDSKLQVTATQRQECIHLLFFYLEFHLLFFS